jgi:hypothetical protein
MTDSEDAAMFYCISAIEHLLGLSAGEGIERIDLTSAARWRHNRGVLTTEGPSDVDRASFGGSAGRHQ